MGSNSVNDGKGPKISVDLHNLTGIEVPTRADKPAFLRKVDWRIVPITFLCYLMNLIDKVALNVSGSAKCMKRRVLTLPLQYAVVMGLTKDLGLTGDDFSNTATVFFAAYLIAEIPTGIVSSTKVLLTKVH